MLKTEIALTNIFSADGDGSEDDGTLYSLADEFLQAACALQAMPPTRVNYSLVTYYLLGHSAELMLKAFLFKHRVPLSDLKAIRHNLESLVVRAKELGLPARIGTQQILQLAQTYSDKQLEYRNRKRKALPNLDHLTDEIQCLQSAIFDKLSK